MSAFELIPTPNGMRCNSRHCDLPLMCRECIRTFRDGAMMLYHQGCHARLVAEQTDELEVAASELAALGVPITIRGGIRIEPVTVEAGA